MDLLRVLILALSNSTETECGNCCFASTSVWIDTGEVSFVMMATRELRTLLKVR